MFPYTGATNDGGEVCTTIKANKTEFPAEFASGANNPYPVWGFFIHASCWELFQANCSAYGTKVDVQALFDILRSLPVVPCRVSLDTDHSRCGAIDWGHDYEGLKCDSEGLESGSSFRSENTNPFPGEEEIRYRWRAHGAKYTHNPHEVKLLRELFEKGKSEWTHREATRPSECYTYSDCFRILPTELLGFIAQEMRSRDVANLRIASPTFASLKLTDQFWHSRSLPGRDFELVYETHNPTLSSLNGTWLQLWREIKARRRGDDLWNRERVWDLATWARELIEQRAESRICHGEAVSSDFERDVQGRSIRTTARRIVMTAGCEKNSREKDFISGTRTLHIRRISKPNPITFESLLASCVQIHGKSYVSGLEMIEKDGHVIKLGYMHTRCTMPVFWKEGHHGADGIVRFDMAVDARGIRGLSLISRSNLKSTWVGDWKNVPKRTLTIPGIDGDKDRCLLTIEAELDALKLVRLTIASRQPASDVGDFRRQHIWLPEVPPSTLKFAGSRQHFNSREKVDKQRPFTWVLFGGEHGEHLENLTGITLWVHEYPRSDSSWRCIKNMILGIEFNYSQPDDGKDSVILGRRPDSRWRGVGSDKPVRFEMKSGERIVSVQVTYRHEKGKHRGQGGFSKMWRWQERRIDAYSTGSSVSGIKMETNMGRGFKYDADYNTEDAEQFRQEALKMPKKGKGAIVGLFGVLERGVNFRNLGIIAT